MKRRVFYSYLLKCKDGTLYCGIAKDVLKREQKHNVGAGSKYVRAHGGGKIVHSERHHSLSAALKREAEVKRWPRLLKLRLIRDSGKQRRPPSSNKH